MPRYANVTPPDARRFAARTSLAHEDVRTLMAMIRRNVRGPAGEPATVADIAALLGLSPSTLHAYAAPPRTDRSREPRGVPYTVVYSLEVLASCPECTATAIWGVQPDGE